MVGGVAPLEGVRQQLSLLYVLLDSVGLGTLVAMLLAHRHSLTSAHQPVRCRSRTPGRAPGWHQFSDRPCQATTGSRGGASTQPVHRVDGAKADGRPELVERVVGLHPRRRLLDANASGTPTPRHLAGRRRQGWLPSSAPDQRLVNRRTQQALRALAGALAADRSSPLRASRRASPWSERRRKRSSDVRARRALTG
jgi:hypothetical protein